MKPRNKLDVIVEKLHNMWDEQSALCRKNHSFSEIKERFLDYCHIQIVYLCDTCFEKGQTQHRNLYNRLVAGDKKNES